jgi:uncharacterized Zn finger protein
MNKELTLNAKSMMNNGTYVICPECGGTVYAGEPENLVTMEKDSLVLRCRNNCCGHVGRYPVSELIARVESSTVDHTGNLLH